MRKTIMFDSDLIEKFKNELEKVNGECFVIKNINEALKEIKNIITKDNIRYIVINNKINIAQRIYDELKKDSNLNIASVDETYKNNLGLKEKLKNVDLGISCADYLVAQTGSVVLKSSSNEPRLLSLLPKYHIVLSIKDSIIEKLENIKDFISNEKCTTVITGPSRTADIEKVLVTGVHGPRKLYVFIFCTSDF